MDTIWKICCLALMTITLSGQVAAQSFVGYYEYDGNMVTMTCDATDGVSSSQADTYDHIEIFMSAKTLDTFAAGSVIQLASKTEGDQDVTYHVANPNDKYAFSMDYTKASASLIIDSLVYDDDARYWCTFEDRSGSTNSPDDTNAIDLTVLHKATIALTNDIDNTETNELADGDAAPSSDVVSGHPVSFVCELTDSNPAPTIVWKIDGTEVTDGGGISITTGTPQEGSDPLLKNIDSTLTFTPQLNDDTGVVAFDENVVECEATQSWKGDELSTSCLSKQQLNVLLRPVQAGMTFFYDGTTYNHGDTIDIVRGQTIDIRADVIRSRGESDITFAPNITPLDSPSTGTETDAANAGDSRLSDSSRTYSFRAVNGNHGDSLEFSANNDAIDYAGVSDPTVSISFNLLAGPDSSMSSTNPVDDSTDGPYTGEHDNCDQEITIIAGQDLTITCTSEDVDPFAVITVYQNGVQIGQSSSNTNFGANPHVTADGNLYDTSFDYTFENPQFTDNGDVISCVARNTINGVDNEATSSACLAFVVRPSAGGFTSTVDDPGLGGAAPSLPVTESETQTVSDGETVSYTCSADNASPAATIKWYFTPNGGTRTDITADAGAPNDVEDGDGLIDSTSTLERTFNFDDCGAKIECVISHPQSDVDPAITYEVTLDIPLAPPTDTLPLISSGGDDYARANTAGDVSTVALDDGATYTFTCTSEDADEEPDIRWNLRNNNDPTGDTSEIDTDIINDTPDCTASSNADSVTITADFDTHHNHRLQCVTENDAGSADSYILLTVEVPPDDIDMYIDQGVIDAGLTHNADEGDDLVFNCVARNANPAAEIYWRLSSRGAGDLNEESETSNRDAGDNLYDTTSTLDLNDYNYQAGDCDAVLRCTTVHDETGNTNPLTDSVTLKVRVPPETVSISLLASSDAAALSGDPTTDLTTTQAVDGETLIFLHGRDYDLQATTNEEDPPADFVWERRTSADGFEDTLDTYTAPSNDISCNEASSSDDYTLNNVEYNDYNNRRIRVTADNEHDDGAAENYVLLDVYAEVKNDNSNYMELIVTDNPVVDLVDGEYILTHGEDYTVDCLVKQATPVPTIDLHLAGDLGGTPEETGTTDPDETDRDESDGVLLSQMVTTGRDTFTADYVNHCGESLVCSAINAANTLLGEDAQTISYVVKVVSPISSVDLSWTDGTGGSFDVGTSTAIVIDTTSDNEFECVVTGADEEADVELVHVGTNNDIDIDSWAATEQQPNCVQETDTEESSLFPTVDYATHHDTTLRCCAQNSAGQECDDITLEVHKPPEQLNLYVTGIGDTETQYYDGDTVYIQAGETDFRCEALNSNPAVTIEWEFSDRATNTPSNPTGTEVPGAPDSNDLVDVENTITNRDIDECYTVTCSATNDAITALGREDDFTIEINVVPSVGPGDPVLVLTSGGNGDEDDDTDDPNEHAILIEDTEYEFECTVAINMADPDAHIRWELYNANDRLLADRNDDSVELQADCSLDEVKTDYTLDDSFVTYEGLQCGYLKCIAYHGTDSTSGNEAIMYFQIWKLPEPSPAGGGGDGIELRYREVGDTDPWPSQDVLTNDQDLTLDVDTEYEFQCTVFGVNPVNPLTSDGGPAAGNCLASGPPTSSVQRDVLNINFYYENALDDGVSTNAEPATYDSADKLYDLTDTWTGTITADDECPADLICRADFNADGTGTPANTDTPYIVVHITRSSPTTEVEIKPPTFNGDIRGEMIDEDNLALYDGDTYELTCAARGADPDTEIIWWLVDDCSDVANDASNGAPSGPIREVFDPTETEADCDRQNMPVDNDDDIDVWSSFSADFDDHHMKCLRCISGDGEVDQFTLDIRKAPSEIILFDGPTDDDSDGDTGEDDELHDPQPVCNGEPFDFMAIAYAANPAVDPFEITLNDVTVGDNTPDNGIDVGVVDVTDSNIDEELSDSKVIVSFPAGSLTLADNEHIIEVCDPESNVCEEFHLDIVDLPDSPVELLITDPFAAERTPPGNPTDTRELNDGDNPVRLHLDETYTFTCNAEDARPYAELKYTLNPPNGPLNYSPTTASPDPADADLTTLFDSSSTFLYTPSNFASSGSTFCCVAENTATEIECGPVPVDTCVTLEIIDEPSDVIMEFAKKDGAGSGFEPVGNMVENDNTYTDLREDDYFDFRCTALESAPKADIRWEFEPIEQYDDFDLLDNADGPTENVDDSLESLIEGRVDTSSIITFQASKEVQGGRLKCCADHIAIPDDEDDIEIYEDPGLEPICVETILRFPVAPSYLEIWELPEGAGQPNVFNEGDEVKANVGEELVLNCTSYESRPKTYIGWSSSDLDVSADPARVSSFIASDCPYSYKISNAATTDPLTLTYDTTKCVYLTPIEEDHLRKVYCSAINIADTAGDDTLTYVKLYLCIPCAHSLELLDVPDSGNLVQGQTDSYDNNGTVVFKRNGEERTLSCVNWGARDKPVIDIYIQEAGSDEPILLTSNNGITYFQETDLTHEDVIPINAKEDLWKVEKRVTLSVGGHSFDISGATLICKCTNSVFGGESTHTIKVTLKVFDQPPVSAQTYMGTGTQDTFEDIDGGRIDLGAVVLLNSLSIVSGNEPDPFEFPNFPAVGDIIDDDIFDFFNRAKRQTEAETNEMTCYTLGTKPAVDFIWKLDDQVISGDFINTYSEDSVLNQGPGQGLVDTYSTINLDPAYRGYHSRELCCEISSSIIGSPIKRCSELIVLGRPNSPLEVSGTNVVNEGQTVQLQCTATQHFPAGAFQWDDSDGNTLLSDEAQSPTQLQELNNFRLEQYSQYSFTATREDNGKNLVCKFDQHFDKSGITFDATTTGEIEIAVNFCPSSNAQLIGCPAAPVAPGRAVTVSCETAVSNPALRIDWYLNNIAQSPSGASTTQARDYGYVTVQTFTTRQLGDADDGLQLQCCPTHATSNIGCGQLCSSVCTVRVEQPPPDVGCRWVRLELTLEHIDGDDATWHTDYENSLSAAYRTLTNGLTDVLRQVFDGLPDYRSAIVPTIKESPDGLVQVIVGLEFDSPYASTTDHITQALHDATDGDGRIIHAGGNVSPYDVLPNSVTAVCVCQTGYCVRGPECTPSIEDFSSSCECPENYAPPRCDVYVPPGPGTQPPTSDGILYGRLAFILDEINDIPAIWSDDYDDLTDSDTQDLINGLDTVLTGIFSPAFSTCFRNVRIADLFQASQGGIGVVAGIDFSHDCGVTVDDLRETFLENIDNDQRIDNSIYELDGDFLSETNVEEVCGNDFSCSNGGHCVPSDTLYYNSCECPPGYSGSRCQDLVRIVTTKDPLRTETPDPKKGLSTEALIGIIIGVVLFAAILIGLLLLCCFLCGDRERVRTRYVYTDDDEPPRRGYSTPPGQGYGSYPKGGRKEPYDDWPWASDGRPPVAYNRDTFDFESRRGAQMGPRAVFS